MINGALFRELDMNIYVGNLPWSINDDSLRDLFSAYGEVSSANVIMDKFSGRSKGFGFVEMPNNNDAEAAIKALDQSEVSGRNLRVNQAKPREDRPRGPRH
jgi:RNA recognition motif-containing protein